MKRALVTGASGLLGPHVATRLEADGWRVVRHGLRRGELQADLRDLDATRAALRESRADAVVNLVALTNVDRCEAAPSEAFLLNTRSVENIAQAALALETMPFLVHISTDQLYDGPGPHAETAARPVNYYGFSKYAGELAAAAIPATILRTNFFGRSRTAGRASFSDWVIDAVRRGEPIRVFEDVHFSPLSVGRLADLIALALDRRVRGTFNLGSREGMSKADFCFEVAHVMGLSTDGMQRATSVQGGLHAYRPKDMRLDSTRFERELGVKLPTLREEILSIRSDYLASA
ncbi:MAG: SDR family oxidoreductase [Gammaproteobacteria bacterium]